MTEKPIRKLQRLSGYDYSHNGIYFVTICSENRRQLFGEISTKESPNIELSVLGLIVRDAINAIPIYHKEVRVLSNVIMPNHVHLLLEIESTDILMPSTNLSNIIKGLKAYVSKTAKENGIDSKIWQKSFHDHIIRDELDLQTHYEYILSNVDHWREDEYCTVD